MLIGLSGRVESGKSHVATLLETKYGFKRVSWAAKLKKIALILNPLLKGPEGEEMMRLAAIIEKYGWDKAKQYQEVREFLQTLGTECVRDELGEDIWIDAALPEIRRLMRHGEDVVIDDVRFNNEVHAITRLGGSVARISREGEKTLEHSSENQELVCHYEMKNDDGIERKIDVLINSLREAENEENSGKPDQRIVESRWSHTVDRAITLGVRLVLEVACPYDERLDVWKKRHVNDCTFTDENTLQVMVDESIAGEVCYDDGLLTVDCSVAR